MKQMHPIVPALLITLLISTSMTSCNYSRKEADLIMTNGVVYTVDPDFSKAEAIAVKDGRIIDVGTTKEIREKYLAPRVVDLQGDFVYPGWIDAHCHFFGYGMNLNSADLVGTASVEEITGILKEHHDTFGGSWITGRGWDQNDWDVAEFPDRTMLDAHFPEIPVLLRRVDGHAAWVNTKALEMAGITAETKVEGGSVLLKEGSPSGILIDNAIDLVDRLVPPHSGEEIIQALHRAEENCFRVGLTSVNDAGLPASTIRLIDSLYSAGDLKIRINAWVSATEENFREFVEKGPRQTDHLTVNTLKLFADGALGSRGARMTEPYADDPGNSGLFVTPEEVLEQYCRIAYKHKFAVATHCIGDAANRRMLEIYGRILKPGNDRRWRIEHAQVIHPDDFHLFGKYNITPSVQPTHATSDMYWAEQRLGTERMEGAYAYRRLLDENGWLAAGSDFPVEDINPLYGFYAAVERKDHTGYPGGGFMTEQALTREEALRAMTIWAARAGFEEHLKGSIEKGKLADLVITGTDLMTAPGSELFRIPVKATYSGGELVHWAGK
ncbi:MAG TPA: amidohydrolase [Bacteroides sp.]|nr:amidohydrolase [Bacteroides sp.]